MRGFYKTSSLSHLDIGENYWYKAPTLLNYALRRWGIPPLNGAPPKSPPDPPSNLTVLLQRA